jgi:hypothetical protein
MAKISQEELNLVTEFRKTHDSLVEQRRVAYKDYSTAKKELEDNFKASIKDIDVEISKRAKIIELLEGKKVRKPRTPKAEVVAAKAK